MLLQDVCQFYLRGKCIYGDCCTKYHPPKTQKPNQETKPNVKNNDYYPTGLNSNASTRPQLNHSEMDSNQNRPRVICIHYQRGNCNYGDTCFKLHIDPQPNLEKQNAAAFKNGATYPKPAVNPKSTVNPNIPSHPTSASYPKSANWLTKQDLPNGLFESNDISAEPEVKVVTKRGCDRPDPINTYRFVIRCLIAKGQ